MCILYILYIHDKTYWKITIIPKPKCFQAFWGGFLDPEAPVGGIPNLPTYMYENCINPGNQPPFQEMVASFWMTINPYVPKKNG